MRLRSVRTFFSSVKLAIVLFILVTLASIVGTLIPQGRDAAEYAARYGGLAKLLSAFQLTRLYSSGWFLALLFLFAVNTAVCTLTRLGPKRRKAFGPAGEADARAVAAMRVAARLRLPPPLDAARDRVAAALRARRYRLAASAAGGRAVLLARKRRLGHFGSDVVHLGLLVILAGGLTSGLAGRRSDLALAEGETAAVPGAAFSVRLDRFETEYYPGGGVKDWKSTVTVLEGGAPVGGAPAAGPSLSAVADPPLGIACQLAGTPAVGLASVLVRSVFARGRARSAALRFFDWVLVAHKASSLGIEKGGATAASERFSERAERNGQKSAPADRDFSPWPAPGNIDERTLDPKLQAAPHWLRAGHVSSVPAALFSRRAPLRKI